jgi:hypothetical protein
MRILLIIVALLCSPQPSQAQTNSNDRPSDIANKNTGVLANDDKSHTNDNSNSEKDNDPNWIIAKFTKVLAFVGALQVAACFIQAFIYWRQSRLMKEAIEQNRVSSERAIRAYITITNHEQPAGTYVYDLPNSKGALHIKNTGQTPAFDIITHVFWKSVHGANQHLPNDYPFPGLESIDPKLLKRAGSSFTLGAGNSTATTHGLLPNPEGLSFAEAYQKLLKEEVTLFLFCKVSYRDIFKKVVPHYTTFCCRLTIGPDQKPAIGTYDVHNDAT